jgi:hypothetical protein
MIAPDAFGHLEPERADPASNDLERHSQPRRILKIPQGQVGSCQLLLPELGQRMQTTAEQGSHLLRGHRVAGAEAVDPVQPGTDPDAWRLAAFGVVRHQPGVTFLGRIQCRGLSGQIVITGSCRQLVEAHRHTQPKGYKPATRSGRPELNPAVHGCVAHRIVGYVKQVEIVVMTARVVGSGLRPSQGSGVAEEMVMSQQAMRQAA